MLFRYHEIRKFKVQPFAVGAFKPPQAKPANSSGAFDDMTPPCIVSGEQLPAIRADRSFLIPDFINILFFVIFLHVIYSNNQGSHLLVR